MKFSVTTLLSATALGASLASPAQAQDNSGTQAETQVLDELRVLDTAEAQARQALGSSTVTAEDIEKRPPVNDLADIIRRQPGINLTNSGSGGTYGNNRQIDIRGMGPENTFILIDGKPVQSRNSTRMGRDGERNSRGDTNWVPAEEVDRIEILRGPAAARYGSGAAGGVINIITKGPSQEFHGSITGYAQQPEDTSESNTKRANFSLSGPIVKDVVSFRVYGNYNETSADNARINADASETPEGQNPPGAREGVTNKDINAMLRFTPAQGQRLDIEGSFSRQGNEYAGEYRLSGSGATSPNVAAMVGEETNVIKRKTASLNYQGDFDFGTAKLIAQYEHTRNRRLNEGLAGGPEGTFNTTTNFSTSRLKNWYVNGSLDIPFETGSLMHVLTVGGEFRYEYLNDPYAMSQGISNGTGSAIEGAESGTRSPSSNADTWAGFIEDNIIIGPVTVTPGVRFDRHSQFGSNWSPSLNLSVAPIPDLTFKGGIARAFKAPNLYQSNPNYLYYTMGNGCPLDYPSLGGGCYVQGNADLDAERSVNKEIGVAYAPEGWNFSITYFRNDYDNKILAGNVPVGTTTGGTTTGRVFQWQNAPKAVVEGLEGNVLIPFGSAISFNTNVTYMIQNKNKTTGEKLSVIPEYTINSTLDWQVTEQINLLLTFTRYGKQEPNRVLYSGATPSADQLRPRPAYNQVGINTNFRVNRNFRLGLGVSNLFNKRLYRESSNNAQGANNYNEPGRAFFVTSTASF
ncbi:outer membrane receptor FepA [Sphingobium jiangsuense]|uniref:Ferric enterobactin receptor n=1 Tax=Sphingobium jiangsuense TaxID=870476 RepID=A0A7W6FRX2_9SPHN|nr:FepA family TonB-dependent siderophore receptor [Sphingobium jiangsuense]MBB3928453.1 ferric enterobactin receptor [Sphingobium jiangsuense]GLT02491.1 outer membrane receptor FepA [Sphingobium jiangsuense]